MIPQRYIPDYLKSKDKKKQKRELKKSRKRYKEKKYYTRKKIKSFKNKVSPHIKKAMRMYKVDNVRPTRSLAKATGCSISALRQIVKKGQGAYFSSGSRPNQTAHSWGHARLASSITGGKAAAVDLHVLEKGCKKNSKALRLAKKSKKKYKKKGMKVTRKVSLKGGAKKKERIVNMKKSDIQHKKYTAFIKNISTGKIRQIHFGDNRYQQFKDSTKLKKYAHLNHGDKSRKNNYYSRHSGTRLKGKAIAKEFKKSGGLYTAKILSHIYLW